MRDSESLPQVVAHSVFVFLAGIGCWGVIAAVLTAGQVALQLVA